MSFWNDILGLDLSPGEGFPAFAVALGCVTGIIITIAYYVSSTVSTISRQRSENELKREMLDRGMSADEIAKVIAATRKDDTAQMIEAANPFKRK
jgi:hypothetical protein